ncbi:hypothetical protein TIFTF001_020308 [Ficus carica]|uniref:Uncharacterized protein n=1 Tax=Ficus carica TaxID=3494 RepID=A0AA88D9P5_FICCA|nr:hypothetical protein TIFTF001_020308 [Ficus carica]
MFRHVDKLPASEPLGLASVTSPATGGVSRSRSTKDGVDYVFLLRLVRPILPGGWRRSAARPG